MICILVIALLLEDLLGLNPALWILVAGQLFCLRLYERASFYIPCLLCVQQIHKSSAGPLNTFLCFPVAGWRMVHKKNYDVLVCIFTVAMEVLTDNPSIQLLTRKSTQNFKLAAFVDKSRILGGFWEGGAPQKCTALWHICQTKWFVWAPEI